jgi:hypothetical protein
MTITYKEANILFSMNKATFFIVLLCVILIVFLPRHQRDTTSFTTRYQYELLLFADFR